MSDKDEIKELFQRELGNYEAKVDPSLWAGVQSGISSGASAASSIGIASKVIIGVLSTAALVVSSILIYNSFSEGDDKNLSSRNTENSIEKNIEVKDDESKIIEDKQKENTPELVDNNKSQSLSIKTDESSSVDNDLDKEESSSNTIPENSSEHNNPTSDGDHKVNDEIPVNTNDQVDNEENSSSSDEVKDEEAEPNRALPTLILVPSIIEQNNQYVKFETSTENIEEIVWDFGDGNLSTQMNPEHFYDKPGTYNVKVTGRNGKQEVYREINVIVEIEGQITKTPNSFTPNGDRDNDYLFIESEGLKEFQITILNNKQEVVYKSNDIHFKWDGNLSNGTPAPEGNYIYIIVAKDNQDNTLNNYQQLHLSR